MAESITITLTQKGLLRVLNAKLPTMRARGDIKVTSGDVGIAGAIAKHLIQDGFTVSREVDSQYLDMFVRELGADGFTHGGS